MAYWAEAKIINGAVSNTANQIVLAMFSEVAKNRCRWVLASYWARGMAFTSRVIQRIAPTTATKGVMGSISQEGKQVEEPNKANEEQHHAGGTGYDPEGFDGGRFNHPQYVVRVREKSNG